MKIKPNAAYRHASYPASSALDPSKEYDAVWATNQPDWVKLGKVFVECDGAPELLLDRTEYKIIDDGKLFLAVDQSGREFTCECDGNRLHEFSDDYEEQQEIIDWVESARVGERITLETEALEITRIK